MTPSARQSHMWGRRLVTGAAILGASVGTCVFGTAAAPAAAASRSAHHGPSCAHYKCVTLAADAQVRIFQARNRRDSEGTFRSTFARWLSSGRITALGDHAEVGGTALEALAVNGRFVAYALGGSERSPGAGRGEAVYRLDAGSGRRTQVGCGGSERTCAIAAKAPGVTDVATTSAGSVAWIVGGLQESTQPFAVFVLPAGSATATQLAASAAVVPHSLAAVSGHVYWMEGEAARQALAR